MKRHLFTLGFALAGTMLFTSCNKDLKEDIDTLESQVKDLQSQNESLQNAQVAPLNVVTTFEDNDGATRTVTNTYRIQQYSTTDVAYMIEWEDDDVYEIKIRRDGNTGSEDFALIKFSYNVVTKEVVEWKARHDWDGLSNNYNTDAHYWGGNTGATFTVTVNSLDLKTGYIDFTAKANADETYIEDTVPNTGKVASTTFQFKGKLLVASYEEYQNSRMAQ